MSRLLPFKSETAGTPDDAKVLDLGEDASGEALSALSSETARKILAAVYEEPKTPPEIREEVGTSLQNVHYHVENLEEANLIRDGGTGYSEKGTEMTVYAPANEAVVLFAGREHDRSRLKTALSRLLGGVGILALASLAVQRFVETIGPGVEDAGDSLVGTPTDAAGGAPATDTEAATETPMPEPTESTEVVGVDAETATEPAADTPVPTEEAPTLTVDVDGTPAPTPGDTAAPTAEPAPSPTDGPIGTPTATPGPEGTPAPTATSTATDTATRMPEPTAEPTGSPTAEPTGSPTAEPTGTPTEIPTATRADEGTATETAEVVNATNLTETPTATPVEGAGTAAESGADGLLSDPAVAFFLGGLFMLVVVTAWWYAQG
jgi:DNA-binding transcriptional ArsR family regulator